MGSIKQLNSALYLLIYVQDNAMYYEIQFSQGLQEAINNHETNVVFSKAARHVAAIHFTINILLDIYGRNKFQQGKS